MYYTKEVTDMRQRSTTTITTVFPISSTKQATNTATTFSLAHNNLDKNFHSP